MAQNDRAADPSVREEIYQFLGELSAHDDMELSAFLRLFKPKSRPPTQPSGRERKVAPSVKDLAHELSQAFQNDNRFDAALAKIEVNKAVTKPVLVSLFGELFGTIDGVPKKATRSELLRLIADERLVAVRDAKATKNFRPVPAE